MELAPETKDLFKNVGVDDTHSGAFHAHAMRITGALDMLINLLDDPDVLDDAIDHLADQHSHHDGIKKEHFAVGGQMKKPMLVH